MQYAADDLDHFHRGELKERESVSAIWSRLRVHTDPFKELRVTGGDVRLSCIETQLDDFRKSMMQRAKTSHKRRRPDDDDLVLRSREQRIFHTAYVNTCLPHIYGTEWATSSIRVLKRRRVDELSIGTLVRAPRRFGKSWAVGQFNAVILIYCPGLTIAIFARTKRQTGWLAGITVRFIMMAGKGGRILKYSGETLFVGIKDKWEYHKIASLVPDNERSRLDYYPDGTSGTCFFFFFFFLLFRFRPKGRPQIGHSVWKRRVQCHCKCNSQRCEDGKERGDPERFAASGSSVGASSCQC